MIPIIYLILFFATTSAIADLPENLEEKCTREQNNIFYNKKKDAAKCAKDYLFSITDSTTGLTCQSREVVFKTLSPIMDQLPQCTPSTKENSISPKYVDIVIRLMDNVLRTNPDQFGYLKNNSHLCSEEITNASSCLGIQRNIDNPVQTLANALYKYSDMVFHGCDSVTDAVRCFNNLHLNNKCQKIVDQYIIPINMVFETMQCKMDSTQLREELIQCHKEVMNKTFQSCKDLGEIEQKLMQYSYEQFTSITKAERGKHNLRIKYYIGQLNITMEYKPSECTDENQNVPIQCIKKETGVTPEQVLNVDNIFKIKLLQSKNACVNFNNTLACIQDSLRNTTENTTTNCREEYSLYYTKVFQHMMHAANCDRVQKDVPPPLNPLNTSRLTPAHIGFIAVGIIVIGGIISSAVYIRKRLRRRQQNKELMEMN